MAVISAITYFVLGAAPWVWLIPLAIAALVVLKWALHAKEDECEEIRQE